MYYNVTVVKDNTRRTMDLPVTPVPLVLFLLLKIYYKSQAIVLVFPVKEKYTTKIKRSFFKPISIKYHQKIHRSNKGLMKKKKAEGSTQPLPH